jgi:hypothetical protein
MSRVKTERFDMAHWQCGTVACVCGHQAVSKDLTDFPRASKVYAAQSPSLALTDTELLALTDTELLAVMEIDLTAARISQDLDYACKAMFKTDALSGSIWGGGGRQRRAEDADILTQEQLKHPHLTTDSSPADVVSYIDMLLGVIDV